MFQACRQRANELAGLSYDLRHLQHWGEVATDQELLVWMRTQHCDRALPPLDPVSGHSPLCLYTCIYNIYT